MAAEESGAGLPTPASRRCRCAWLGTLDDPAATLAERGGQATLTQPGEPGAHYGRWPFPVLAPGLPGAPRDWFVTARRG